MAFLSGSCLAHDLATFDSLLLARWYTAMTVGLKVIDRKRAIMVHMRVKRQHQCRTLLHNPYPCVATAMEPTLMTFGTLKPPFQIQIVCRKIGGLTTDKQPQLKAAHHFGEMLVHGIRA